MALNEKLVDDHYITADPAAILTKASGALFISMRDLKQAFWQIPMEEKSRKYTSFRCFMGQFCFNFMPYGLKVGPKIFQRLMDKILRGAHSYAAVHLDDIACLSMTWDQHLVHLREIFTRLRNAELTLNTNKCQWAMECIHCLGH